MLRINGLHAEVSGKDVIHDLTLKVGDGESIILMGANGSGKSSLANVLIGNPNYKVNSGSVTFEGKDLLLMDVSQRAKSGIYLAWQNPVAIPGVSVFSYLRVLVEAHGQNISSMVELKEKINALAHRVGLSDQFASRAVNDGFSGGEKKRFELLQIMMLTPKLVILDEIDSGLDVDGLKLASEIMRDMQREYKTSFLVITHYKRMLDYMDFAKVVVLSSGKVITEGSRELANQIESRGYKGIVDANES